MGTRKKVMRGAAIGSITLRLFRDLPDKQAGWLVKAWIAYREDGTEPESVPPACRVGWIAVKEEADNMAELSRMRSEAGTAGNASRWGTKEKKENRNESQSNRKTSQSNRNESQTVAEESRGEENIPPSGVIPAPTRARETPTPQGNPKIEVPTELAEAMKGAPLSPAEALDYAAGPHCGITRQQVQEWAEWYAQRDWALAAGGAMRPMSKDAALASMRRWKNRQPEIDALRKRTGGAGKDETIPGVRVSNKGGVPRMDF